MEERVERREIKGKNSSEITELFIFPALSLWAFEEVTLMYLCVLGPSAAAGPPGTPPKAHCFYQQQLPPLCCPWSLLKWVLPVFIRPRVRNVCRVLAVQLGEGETGVPSSVTSLFIWVPRRAFLHLLLNAPRRRGTPILGRGVGITNTGPPLPVVLIALQCQAALGFLNKDEDEGLQLY